MMRCPKCGDEQKKSDTCAQCGIVVEKYLKIKQSSGYQPPAGSAVSYMNDVEDEAQTSPFLFNMITAVGIVTIVIASIFYLS